MRIRPSDRVLSAPRKTLRSKPSASTFKRWMCGSAWAATKSSTVVTCTCSSPLLYSGRTSELMVECEVR